MRFIWGVAFALSLAGTAWARQESGADKIAMQDTETEKLRKAAAEEKKQDAASLPERVSKLEKMMQEQKQTYSPEKMLYFETADGNFTAKVGGRLYVIYRHTFDRPDNSTSKADTFEVDTARLQLDGTFYKDYFYRVEGEAGKGSTLALKDCYMGWSGLSEYFTFKAGQMKEPFSQEETCSSRFIDFAERSIMNQLVPQHDMGIMFNGSFVDKIVEWELGLFNGSTAASGRNTADTDDEKDVAVRLRVTPLKNSDLQAVKQLRIGVAATYGDQDGKALADLTTKDISGQTFVDFGAQPIDGIRKRYGVELSWLFGPASLRAEYMIMNQEVIVGATEQDYDTKGYYVQATWLLTGEDKPLENRVKPKANFSIRDGGWGAFELAARFASVDASDAEQAGLLASTACQKATEWTVGVNWWMTPNVAVRLNWEHFDFDEDLLQGNANHFDSQDVVYIRWQIDF